MGRGARCRRLRGALPLVALAAVATALVAGCGGSSQRAAPSSPGAATGAGEAGSRAVAPGTSPGQAPAGVSPVPSVRLVVVVVDGDTGKPVAAAQVRIGGRRRIAGAGGRASARFLTARSLRVVVTARGFESRVVVLSFKRARQQRVLVYRTAAQWRMYGAGAGRTQAQHGIRLRPPFRVVWSRGLGSLLEFPAVVSEGVAYIAGFDGIVHALAMADGAELWRYTPANGKSASSPTVWGDLLVVHDMRGQVTLLDRATGGMRRRFDIGSPIESSPLVLGGIDYFGTWDGRVVALDLRSGGTRWSVSVGQKITASAAVANGLLVIGDYGGTVHALDPATGVARWRAQVNGRVYGTAALADGRAFVPSSSGASLTALSLADGSRLWRRTAGSYVYAAPAVWGGRIVFGSYDGLLRCVSAATGETLWTVSAGKPISGAVVAVGGVAYAGTFAHRILGVDVATGKPLLDFPHGEYVPVSGNGGRLLLHGYSRLFAVEPVR